MTMTASTKTLFLVRHAKSDWQHVGITDHERPLNHRGTRDIAVIAARVAAWPDRPAIIVTSSALRALTTAQSMAAALGFVPSALQVRDEIYHADADTLLDVIQGLDDRYARVMLVGHNPGMTEIANELTDSAIDNMPTCAVAVLRFDVASWAAVRRHSATLVDFDFPKR